MSEKTSKPEYKFLQNRELSWLRFNERVLHEAARDDVPLFEKLKFIAIFTSNLDEFFMVRVGSLFDLAIADKKVVDNKSGMSPSEQLAKIYSSVKPLYRTKDEIYKTVSKKLKAHGICRLTPKDLTAADLKFAKNYFLNYIRPILSPQIADEHHPFPFIASKQLCVVGKIQRKKSEHIGLVTVPQPLPQVLFLPGEKIRYIHTEDIIYMYLEDIFDGCAVSCKNIFCATRNADINPNDEAYEINEDFRSKMKKLLKKRRRLAVVRLETAYELEEYTKNLLCSKLSVTESRIFVTKSPMNLGYVYDLVSKFSAEQTEKLCYPQFAPQRTHGEIMTSADDSDILLSYPYESMDPFVDMIKRAASAADVISIKITIYRLAKNAKLIEHLCTAAENGKDVLALFELRARFDEQNNIDHSLRLEQSGCRIVYGLSDYKVHSKVCLITRSVRGETLYTTQIGTGNYNEKTAKQYTDLSLITQNREIGEDAADFFRNISISNLNGEYKHLLVAPNAMKNRIIEYIDEEIQKGLHGRIFIKVNAVTDKQIIMKLRQAGAAGVEVTMLVRGICCLLPGIHGLTENIKVYSIVGRFLEHSRIYSFGKGSEQKLFISSADLMTRNMDKRVEVGCPIYSPKIKKAVNHYIEVCMSDTEKLSILKSDGTYENITEASQRVNSHEVLMNEAKNAANAFSAALPDKNKNKIGFLRRIYNAFITRLYNNLRK